MAERQEHCHAEIVSVARLLQMNLSIPRYQRPYKWTRRNVLDLVNDIKTVIEDRNHGRYRVGSVILLKNGDCFDIVDGQQRIITFVLMMKAIGVPCVAERIFEGENGARALSLNTTQKNLRDNYRSLVKLLSVDQESGSSFIEAIEMQLEVVVITINNQESAFQLFDSQNTRGRRLDPHDLLKAYHLRAMHGRGYEMRRAVNEWENIPSSEIRGLFSNYLFPIQYWIRKEKASAFTDKDIDVFKGIDTESDYSYAQRTTRAMPYYQLGEQFMSGANFFGMVVHYLNLLKDLREEYAKDDVFSRLVAGRNKSVGYLYARQLFECTSLCYYDRFGRFDHDVLGKLARWAFMIHLDMTHLGYATINKYAVGEAANGYTNVIPMFSLIRNSRQHLDLLAVEVADHTTLVKDLNAEKRALHNLLREIDRRGRDM